ncbi:MAG: hypothetical protein ACRD96_28030 [Bryobacteraceae bacterium]
MWWVWLALFAQQEAPLGVVRGRFLQTDGDQFFVRAASRHVYRFRTDRLTFVERDRQRIALTALTPGDYLQIVSDTSGEMGIRYARLVEVIETLPPVSRLRYRSTTQHIAPRGRLVFAGAVLRIGGGRLLLRTRVDGDKHIVLRDDTNYRYGGTQVDAADLTVPARVQVRGGRNLYGEIEAYEVVWGRIDGPRSGQ